MKKILFVDDDRDVADTVVEMLKNQFEVLIANSGKEGLQIAIRDQPELVLLDVNMPDMSGFDVCQRLRDTPGTRHIPVVMLTVAGELDSRVRGLELGADDYIAKPFHARELMARINARLRHRANLERGSAEVKLGNLRLNPKSAEVWVDETSVHLTPIEFDLLHYFLEHPNQVIPRNRLLGDLWPDAVVTNRTVDTHIANLRKKINGFRCELGTVYGSGYILKTSGQESHSA